MVLGGSLLEGAPMHPVKGRGVQVGVEGGVVEGWAGHTTTCTTKTTSFPKAHLTSFTLRVQVTKHEVYTPNQKYDS